MAHLKFWGHCAPLSSPKSPPMLMLQVAKFIETTKLVLTILGVHNA